VVICQTLFFQLLLSHPTHQTIDRTSAWLVLLGCVVNESPKFVDCIVVVEETVRRETT
jgi:hypothetical protein